MTKAERKVLEVLRDKGEQWNGSLGIEAGLHHNSAVFRRLEQQGLINGPNPMSITEAGRAAINA